MSTRAVRNAMDTFPTIIPVENSTEMPNFSCELRTIREFNEAVNGFCGKSFSILAANIRGMRSNFPQFEAFLKCLKIPIDIIVLTEIFLTELIDLGFALQGYKCETLYRNNNGGGIKVFYRDCLEVSRLNDLTFMRSEVECLGLRVRCHDFSMKLISVYRPPNSSLRAFNEILFDNIFSLLTPNEKVLFCGDYNANLFNPSKLSQIESLKNLFIENGYVPVINVPTHFTPDNPITKYSLIDHMWANFIENPECVSSVIDFEVSDHLPTIFVWKCNSLKNPDKFTVFRRTRNELNQIRFSNLVFSINMNRYVHMPPSDAVEQFLNEIYQLYYECFPLVKKKITTISEKPWITCEIKRLIDKKHRLISEWKRGIISRNSLNKYCKVLSRVIKALKENYLINKLENLKKSTRKLWKEMNTMMERTTANTGIVIKDDGMDTNNKTAANLFNEYFASVASKLAEKFSPEISLQHGSDEDSENREQCYLEPTSAGEITQIVKSFSAKKLRKDEIQPFILYMIIPIIAPLLAHLFNKCVTNGVYPNVFKVARVVPLHKAGDKTSVLNYRPISTLSIFNKIFEKIIHDRLYKFITNNRILTDAQFGFRKSSDTGLATFSLVTDLLESFKNKSYTICMFLDLKKAFDTIDRSILIQKLYNYGVRGNFLNMLKNYLQNRTQYVCLGGDSSDVKDMKLGIIQGSVLGPLLFNIYINDIVKLGLKTILFADDAVFCANGKSVEECASQIQLFANRLSSWLNKNRLTPSETKTKLMLVTPSRKPQTMPIILFNENILEWVDEIKYLGIIIDNKLTFKQQVDYVVNRLSVVQGITYSLKKVLPSSCLRMIYFSLAYPHIIQSLIVWGGTYQTYMQKIALKINAILRNILSIRMGPNYQPLVPTSLMYKKLGIMKIEDVYMFQLLKFYNNIRANHPLMYGKYFSQLEQNHNYGVRNRRINLPYVRTEIEKHGTIFQCALALSSISVELRDNEEPDIFKYRFKNYALSKY